MLGSVDSSSGEVPIALLKPRLEARTRRQNQTRSGVSSRCRDGVRPLEGATATLLLQYNNCTALQNEIK